jgi:hypothetical protein
MAGSGNRYLLALLGGEPVRTGTNPESGVGGLRGHCCLELDLFIPAVGRCSFRRGKMMKIIFAFLLWSIGTVVDLASPFLVCDPYPAGQNQFVTPSGFIVKGLSANPISAGAQVNQDGTVQLHYDLGSLGNGSYTVIADAVNVFGGVSPDSAPFTFTVGLPAPPGNLRIVP